MALPVAALAMLQIVLGSLLLLSRRSRLDASLSFLTSLLALLRSFLYREWLLLLAATSLSRMAWRVAGER